MQQIYLDWNRPVLHSAVDYLFGEHCVAAQQRAGVSDGQWDMERLLLVLPSSLAGRRLGELLAEKADKESVLLNPPEIVTVGALPEKLYQARFPFAGDTVQVLAWSQVLRDMDSKELEPLLLETPDPDNLQAWNELARMLSALHRELATDLLLCGDVADRLKGTLEEPRWRVLQIVQRKYLDSLHESELWDIQTARRVSIEHNEPQTNQQIVVLGAVDLNSAQRKFLDAVASNVTILVGAPESWSAGFDPYGALIPKFWETLRVQFDPGKIEVRGTPVQAADEVARQLAYLGATVSTQEITLGVPDASLIPMLMESLDRVGVSARNGPGQPVEQSLPAQLLRAVSDYVVTGSFHAFGSLVRMSAVTRFINRSNTLPPNYLQCVDEFYSDTLLKSINTVVWPEHKHRELVVQLVDAIDAWLKPLRMPQLAIAEWSPRIQQVMQTVFADFEIDLEREEDAMIWSACSHFNEAFAQLERIPTNVDTTVEVGDGIDWVLQQVSKERTPPLADADAVEMLGWLELALDDAPVLVLTGLHDGFVPESVNSDAFLPNTLRSELGLMDNARRYARDCYVFHTILHSREQSCLVLNHLGVDGSPQTPSRLLLAVEADQLAQRVQKLIHPVGSDALPVVAGSAQHQTAQTQIPIPAPSTTRPVESLSVTAFKSYLGCPYRFYLSHVERLRESDDSATEMAANVFGSLLHDCLTPLIDSDVAQSTDEKAIRKWLFESLQSLADARFGKSRLPAVELQLEQARQRLAAFAKCQAERATNGWEIRFAEVNIAKSDGVHLMVDDEPFAIHGRIDRIDYHPTTERWAVWDYKTGEKTDSPLKAHVTSKGIWKDLQLPLYRRLVRHLGVTGMVELGYIGLPKSATGVGFFPAPFSEDHFEDADAAAAEIIRSVRESRFWPPETRGLPPFDPFGSLCQTSVANRWEPDLDAVGRPIPTPFDYHLIAKKDLHEDATQVGEQLSRMLIGRPRSAPPNVSEFEKSDIEVVEAMRPASRQGAEFLDATPVHLQLKEMPVEGTPPDEWFQFLSIRASAGTGKTYQLAMRLLRLLFSGESPDTVLATTFTRKAAGEILERVLERLAQAITEPVALAQLQIDLKELRVTREHCQYQLARLCANLHRFRVSTLDSFYSQLARSCALELDLPPGWQLIDPFHEGKLRDQAIARMFETQQVAHLRALLSMLAKGDLNRSITSQIRDVVDSGYELFRVTEPAAWERLELPPKPSDSAVNEAYRVAEEYALQKENNFRKALGDANDAFYMQDWDSLLSSTLVKNSHDLEPKYSRKPLPTRLAAALVTMASHAGYEEIALRRKQLEATRDLLAIYAGEFDHVKRRNRAVSFSDISHRLSLWMRDCTSPQTRSEAETAEHIQKIDWRMDANINHLLLDEFQDTSPPQWDVVKPFAEAIAREGVRRGKSFFCVGDTKQAIYGWRGGVAEIFNAVGQQIHSVQERPLLESRRSSGVIMDFANAVFQNLSRHGNFGDGGGIVDSWEREFPDHTTAVDRPGYVQLKNGFKPARGEETDVDSLLQLAADDIAELVRSTTSISIGVLVRSNSKVAEMINLLRDRGLDPSQEGGNPLTDSAAVDLLLQLLLLADHPGDQVAAFHVQNSPLTTVLGCDAAAFPDTIALHVRSCVGRRGYGFTLAGLARLLGPYCTRRDQQRLEQLVQLAFQYDASPTLRVRDFVEYIKAERVVLPKPAQIRVMTTHQSKGLEFDAVFIPDLDKSFSKQDHGLVPMFDTVIEPPVGIIRSAGKHLHRYIGEQWERVLRENSERGLVEELCVFYVALTRARHALYLYATPGKSATQKWGSVLQSLLCDDKQAKESEEQVIYSLGDPDWWQELTVPAATEAAVSMPRIAIQLQPGTEGGFRRFRRSQKPSAAGETRNVLLENALQTNVSVGAIIGTLVHRWFEEVEWLEDFQFDADALNAISLQTLTVDEMANIHLGEWLEEMQRMLGLSSVREALTSSRYASWKSIGVDRIQVCNERRMLELQDGVLIRGTIDRLVLGWKEGRVIRAEVIDYKTDRIDDAVSVEAWESDRVAHHGPQLESYRALLSKQYGLAEDQIELWLVLLSSDSLVSCSRNLAEK
jgi:ATP-dependent exoDNAse (exonuclease V) beta subunit